MASPQAHWALPFFDAHHAELAARASDWTAAQRIDESDDRAACKQWVRGLGEAGLLRYCVPAGVDGELGGALPQLDSRALVVLRETLAFYSPLADFALAMQGLGSGAITLAGTPEQQREYLPQVARGEKIAAFALSEVDAGSDVGAMKTIAAAAGNHWAAGQFGLKKSAAHVADARPDSLPFRGRAGVGANAETPSVSGYPHPNLPPEGEGARGTKEATAWQLSGEKTWISNGGIADFYVVFAKTEPGKGTRGISAFIVDADTPGLDASEHIHVMSPHPLAVLKLQDCPLPATAQLGELNGGFKLAMRTLDIFRASVAAAAIGMARRALHEAIHHAQQRKMFGQTLAQFQLTQAKIGEMAALVDAAALLTYRAAWQRDVAGQNTTVSAAMAKMSATENAQKVIDMALQLHGGLGVKVGSKIEALYRDIRSLRIYEGATEVQQLIIGKALLAA